MAARTESRADVLDAPDNLVIVPGTGDVFLQEDGGGDEQFVRGVTRRGEIYDFARTVLNGTEFCGGCFSPDGRTFFVSQQGERVAGTRHAQRRTGLVDHTAEDRRGLSRGAALIVALAAPAVLVTVLDVTLGPGAMDAYVSAGTAALAVVGPYALIVLLALGAYGALRWELKYLASALILGPFTLFRPVVVVAAAIVAIVHASAVGVTVAVVLAGTAVLLVEPILNFQARESLGSRA
jgi:hypothetical protein